MKFAYPAQYLYVYLYSVCVKTAYCLLKAWDNGCQKFDAGQAKLYDEERGMK